jgi:cation diffusion facilitator CzcD-associated flavoprotein CzcO
MIGARAYAAGTHNGRVDAATAGATAARSDSEATRCTVLIVGAGFAGLGMAIRLQQAGMHDFVVLERAADVGGTWRDNAYPGCMCDVPSALYSFSFAQNPDWSCTYPKREEIWRYLQDCAQRFGILPHTRFQHAMTGARWEERRARWMVDTTRGRFEAQFLVLGAGSLSEPRIPTLPGLETFAGPVFHSANWPAGLDLRGKRVAVAGTGASAIQFVPAIQPQVESLHLFQRTAAWVLPHPNRALSSLERRLAARFPPLLRLRRGGVYAARELMVLGLSIDTHLLSAAELVARAHLRRQVRDAELRRLLTPNFRLGCKRILISNDYYPALTQPNTEVIPGALASVRGTEAVSSDGFAREVDVIVFGTGFRVTDSPLAGLIRSGGTVLADVWNGSPQAYAGTTVAGFPNLFMISGPNTGVGHTSVVYMIESQVRHILRCLDAVRGSGAAVLEARPAVQRRYNERLQRRMRRTVWMTGGCRSWYLDARGRNTALWPSFTFLYRHRGARFDASAYLMRGAAAPDPTGSEQLAASSNPAISGMKGS